MIFIEYMYPKSYIYIYAIISPGERPAYRCPYANTIPQEIIERDKWQHERMLREIIVPENMKFQCCKI